MSDLKVMFLCLLVLLALGCFFYLFLKASDFFIGKHYDKREKKRKEKHPQLYDLFDELREASKSSARWYNNEVSPRIRQIDFILKDWNYYTEKVRAAKEKELEELRGELAEAVRHSKELDADVERLRNAIKEYVKNNPEKWMIKEGW